MGGAIGETPLPRLQQQGGGMGIGQYYADLAVLFAYHPPVPMISDSESSDGTRVPDEDDVTSSRSWTRTERAAPPSAVSLL